MFRFAPILKSHQALFLDDKPAVRVPVTLGASEIPALEPMQWCLFHGYIYLRVKPGEVPQLHYPSCSGLQTGITIYDVQNVTVKNVTIRGFALDGINAHDNGFAVKLEDVVAQDNGRSGYSIGGACQVRHVALRRGGEPRRPIADRGLQPRHAHRLRARSSHCSRHQQRRRRDSGRLALSFRSGIRQDSDPLFGILANSATEKATQSS